MDGKPNKVINKGATFKILIKTTDIDKDFKTDEKPLEKTVNVVLETKEKSVENQEVDKVLITDTKTVQEEKPKSPKHVQLKTVPSKAIRTPVNKDLDFIPEEDTDEEEDEVKPTEDKNTTYDPANVHYEDDVAIYTDPKSGYQYTWDKETNDWKPKGNIQYGFEDDTHTYTDAEGIKYFWDKDKHAWFPKIDDDFMAQYQMSYGFVDNTTKPEEIDKKEEVKEAKKVEKGLKRKVPTDPTWFEVKDEENKNVYVSNLPTDITEEEFIDFMQKCGLVMRDMTTGKMKVKLYVVPGNIKLISVFC